MPRLCTLISPLGDALFFARMRVDEGLSRLFEIELVAHSTRSDIAGTELLGMPLTIHVTFEKGVERHYNGHVTRFAHGPTEGRFRSYRMTLRPWLWFLTRQSDCMVFQAKKIPDIVKEVFEREPTKSLGETSLGDDHVEREYCVQYRENDFNFVSRLMEQAGIYYFFEHSESQHKLTLVDSKGAHKAIPVPEDASVNFDPGTVDGEVHPDRISEWDCSEQIEPGIYSLNDFNYEKPNLNLQAVRKPAVEIGHARGSSEMYDYPGEYSTTKEGETFASHRIEELATQASQFTGSGTLRMFRSGLTFKLAKHPRKDQNDEYLVTSTHYEFVDAHKESGAGEGARFRCSFTAIRAKQQFRPPRVTPRPIVQGVQTAFVTGPSGEEIHTDELGRVKVQFHWDRVGKNDDKSSCWLRVSSIAAGPRFGFVSIPRVGQEVVVSFLEGDPDRPLITGVVYNGLSKPPWELPTEKNRSGFLTRSTKGGGTDQANELRFDDTTGKELFRIHAQRDYEMRTERNLIDWIGGKAERYLKLDHLEKIDGTRHLMIKGDEKAEIKGGYHLKATGDHNSKVGGGYSLNVGMDSQTKAGMKFAVDAGMEVHLKGGMNVTIEAGVSLTLKVGGNFVNINPGGVFITGTMVMINSGGAAGSGGGSSPQAPLAPSEPGEPPEPDRPKIEKLEVKKYSPRAVALKAAGEKGAPFCAICNAS